MTEFHVEVVEIGNVEKHPNADTLSITKIHGGYPVIFKSGEFKPGDLAVYIPVDAVVPDTPEWAWLGDKPKHRRVKAKRLRGVFSMGLLTKAPDGTSLGEDVAERMGITRYDDEPEATAPKPQPTKAITWLDRLIMMLVVILPSALTPRAWAAKYRRINSTNLYRPKGLALPGVYDIEPFRRYGRETFVDGELVVVTEKIHGQNAGFVFHEGQLYARSRTLWRSTEPGSSTWADVAIRYGLEKKLSYFPGIVLYGETYGNNSDMAYGVDKSREGDRFMAFDAYDTKEGRWLNYAEFVALCTDIDVPTVPCMMLAVWRDKLHDELLPFAEGKSTLYGADHVREGFVVKAANERSRGVPRAILKMVGEGYHTRKEAA